MKKNTIEVDLISSLKERIAHEQYTMPIIPAASLRVMNLLGNAQSTLAEIEKAVALDPILTGQILKIANSCLYGATMEVTSLQNALIRLGRKQIRSIIMMASIKSSLIQGKTFLEPMKKLWKQSVACAFLCRVLAKQIHEDGEEFFIIGLLHNVGKIMVLAILYEMLQQNCETLGAELLPKLYHAYQEEIGKKILTTWKMPPNVIEAVTLQSWSVEAIATAAIPPAIKLAAVALILSNRLCTMIEIEGGQQLEQTIVSQEWAYLSLPPTWFSELMAHITDIFSEIAALV